MLARRLASTCGKQLCDGPRFPDNTLVQVARGYSVDHENRQHLWKQREKDAITPKSGDDPRKSKKIFWFPTEAPKSYNSIGNWYKQQKVEYAKFDQTFNPDRHAILGADLATAHFLIRRGGRVKFKGNAHWTERDENGRNDLPNAYHPSYVIEKVDVNGFDLHYDGLSNLCGLTKLEWLSLKDCKNIDDWGLDKISAEFPALQHLDISGCERITERGLESLYRMYNMRKLIVTNHNKSVTFELTCFMLEDCMPGLSCEILMPEEKSEDE